MIAIIDYGAGNLQSVKNALDFLKIKNKITNKKEDIEKADKLILPGVGSFGDIVKNLKKNKIFDLIKKEITENKKPYLGICLGLQILFEKSEENPDAEGFSIFKGNVVKFKKLKIPQIGWNSIEIIKKNNILKNIKNKSYFYFVHSYYVVPEDKEIILTKTNYGIDFISGVAKDNIIGLQFHPERSGEVGLEILRNFAALRTDLI